MLRWPKTNKKNVCWSYKSKWKFIVLISHTHCSKTASTVWKCEKYCPWKEIQDNIKKKRDLKCDVSTHRLSITKNVYTSWGFPKDPIIISEMTGLVQSSHRFRARLWNTSHGYKIDIQKLIKKKFAKNFTLTSLGIG